MALPGYKNSEIILQEYPLHCHIWNDEPVQLDEALTSKLVTKIISTFTVDKLFL